MGDKLVEVIIDSGAATSVISNKLRIKLELPIGESSKIILVLPDGKRVASLGKMEIVAQIFGKEISINAEVIDSSKEEFLIGNNTLQKYGGNIDYENKVTTMKIGDEEVNIPVEYELSDESEDEDGFEDDGKDEYDDQYEDEEVIELFGMDKELKESEKHPEKDELEDVEVEAAKLTVLAEQLLAERQ